MERKTPEERKRAKDEDKKRVVLISNQWKEFSKKEAFKEFMEYLELQDYFAVQGAKGPVSTFDNTSGEQIDFDPVKSAGLLQRSVGYDIVKTYVEGYVNPTTL